MESQASNEERERRIHEHLEGVMGSTATLVRPGPISVVSYQSDRVLLDPSTRMLMTVGMSHQPMQTPVGPHRIELVLAIPEGFEHAYGGDLAASWAPDLLLGLAGYPQQTGSWIGDGHTVPLGHPLHAATSMNAVSVIRNVLLPEDSGTITVDGETVTLLLVTPIHRGELAMAHEEGTEALMFGLMDFLGSIGQDWAFLSLPKRPSVALSDRLMPGPPIEA